MNETECTEVDLSKFRVGTRVTNKKYGEGKVTGIKEGKVMVSFNKAVKTFPVSTCYRNWIPCCKRMVSRMMILRDHL